MTELKPCPFCGSEPETCSMFGSQEYLRCSDPDCPGNDVLCGTPEEWNHRPSPWMPIETAPKDGTNILLTDGVRVTEGGWLSQVDQGADYEGQGGVSACWWNVAMISDPTHWMRIPEPPQ